MNKLINFIESEKKRGKRKRDERKKKKKQNKNKYNFDIYNACKEIFIQSGCDNRTFIYNFYKYLHVNIDRCLI